MKNDKKDKNIDIDKNINTTINNELTTDTNQNQLENSQENKQPEIQNQSKAASFFDKPLTQNKENPKFKVILVAPTYIIVETEGGGQKISRTTNKTININDEVCLKDI